MQLGEAHLQMDGEAHGVCNVSASMADVDRA